jgi:hypothetical protein
VFEEAIALKLKPVFPADHSMGSRDFLRYIRSKVTNQQFSLLTIAVCNGFPIECHAIFMDLTQSLLAFEKIRLCHTLTPMELSYKKVANSIRPTWLVCEDSQGRKKLIIIVSPTKEYLAQYAMIIQSVILFLCARDQGSRVYAKAARAAAAIKATYYPTVTENYSELIGLTKYLQKTQEDNDIYVIGEGDKAFSHLMGKSEKPCRKKVFDADAYQVTDLTLPGAFYRTRIIAIKHSFWGSGAGNVAKACAELGSTKGIIYIAKLGALSPSLGLLEMVSPSEFMLWENGKLTKVIPPPAFLGLEQLSEMNIKTTTHITLPTLMEETDLLLNHFHINGAETIDNEISYIANSISKANRTLTTPVSFSCLHIVTDTPSSSILNKISANEAYNKNHLLSKNDLQYRRTKNAQHKSFIDLLQRMISYVPSNAEHMSSRKIL